jgi:protoporphyrinogen/coproporphyrinogen III oxidase
VSAADRGPATESIEVDVVVIGGGIAGLVAARECAHVGLSTLVLEAGPAAGGCVAGVPLPIGCDGESVTLDVGAESFATRGGSVAALLDDLGLAEVVVSPNPAGAWLALPATDGGLRAVRLPKTGVLGIPASPLADDVRAVIGWRGAIRAYADRVMPILKIGREVRLGPLVRKRMGARVHDDLVAPISSGVYSADPGELDIDLVAPGLNQAMTRAGSLSGGVAQLAEERRAGAAVQGLTGGMNRLAAALTHDLEHFGAGVRTGVHVESLTEVSAGSETAPRRWRVDAMTPGAGDAEDRAIEVFAGHVILATPAATTVPLLARARGEWARLQQEEWPAGASVELATLVLDAPALDGAPRGTGVLVAADTPGVTAKAMTHSSAKWRWLSDAMGAGRHVVRLSYGRAGTADAADRAGGTAEFDDVGFRALALGDASALLGVDLDESQVIAFIRTRWQDAQSHAAIGRRGRVDRLRALLAEEPTVEATGAWLAGTGLASVVPDATAAGLRVRHHALQLAGGA